MRNQRLQLLVRAQSQGLWSQIGADFSVRDQYMMARLGGLVKKVLTQLIQVSELQID
jgi:hypothetical protein